MTRCHDKTWLCLTSVVKPRLMLKVNLPLNGDYTVLSLYVLLFFFQAEDGIRDYKVTGVQTCALPILDLHGAAVGLGARLLGLEHLGLAEERVPVEDGSGVLELLRGQVGDGLPGDVGDRSEERRVGKECTSGRAGQH